MTGCQVTKIRPFLGPIYKETIDLFLQICTSCGESLEKEQMEEQPVNHLESRIANMVSGREGHACLTYLLELFEPVAANTNMGNAVDTVHLDFQKTLARIPN